MAKFIVYLFSEMFENNFRFLFSLNRLAAFCSCLYTCVCCLQFFHQPNNYCYWNVIIVLFGSVGEHFLKDLCYKCTFKKKKKKRNIAIKEKENIKKDLRITTSKPAILPSWLSLLDFFPSFSVNKFNKLVD